MPFAFYIRVIFIIAHSWPPKAVPQHMTPQCDVVSLVQCYHDMTAESKFPGILIHHKLGMTITAGFATCYIGRQIMLDRRKLNIVGIIKYIRQHRWGSFTFEETAVDQLQVVYMVLGSFSRNFAFDNPGLVTTKTEIDFIEQCQKAPPASHEAVSKWGSRFSFVKKASVFHGQVGNYQPPTVGSGPPGASKKSRTKKLPKRCTYCLGSPRNIFTVRKAK